MERVILVRYTEIHLKGLNRPYFEQKLVDNMRSALRGIPSRIDRRTRQNICYGYSGCTV